MKLVSFISSSLDAASGTGSVITTVGADLLNCGLRALHWMLIISDGLLWALVLSAFFILIARAAMARQNEQKIHTVESNKSSPWKPSARSSSKKRIRPKVFLPQDGDESDLSTEVGSDSESDSDIEQDTTPKRRLRHFGDMLDNSSKQWFPAAAENPSDLHAGARTLPWQSL